MLLRPFQQHAPVKAEDTDGLDTSQHPIKILSQNPLQINLKCLLVTVQLDLGNHIPYLKGSNNI